MDGDATGPQKCPPHSPVSNEHCPAPPDRKNLPHLIDDIVIWSNTIFAEHIKHINIIMKASIASHLFCNPKKCNFFLTEMDFLGHHISAQGIEPNKSKIKKILNWPVPMNPTEVQAFLSLVRYIAAFLPKFMDHTLLLTPLTNKMAKSDFSWTDNHQLAFESIKALVVSTDCLTVIDHANPGKKQDLRHL